MPDIATRLTYTIETHNNVAVHEGAVEPMPGVFQFTSHQELEAVAADWPTSRLVGIWNRFPGKTPVKKFTKRQTAVRRIWETIEDNATAPAALRSNSPIKSRKKGVKAAEPPHPPGT